MKKLISVLLVAITLALTYAFIEKTTESHARGYYKTATLTYTGLGFHGSGFFGYRSRHLVITSTRGTFSASASPEGWVVQERDSSGALRSLGLCTDLVSDDSGASFPDPDRILHAVFYAPDGSTTGSVRDGHGTFEVLFPKGRNHFQVSGRKIVFVKHEGA